MVSMALIFRDAGDTLTITPLKRKEKLPMISRLIVEKGITYGLTDGGKFELGQIPEGFTLDRMNKYNEIVFINPSGKPHKKKKVHPIIQRALQMKRPIIIFDLETTGKSVTMDRIISLCAKKVTIASGMQPIEPPVKLLINPGIPIKPEATAVHGITDDMVKDAKPFAFYAPTLLPFFAGCNIGGYNCRDFDIPMLSEEFSRVGISWPDAGVPVFDAYRIFATKEERNLTAAVKFYTGSTLEGAHDAENDVDATIAVLAAQLVKYSDLQVMDEAQLHAYCSGGVQHLDVAGKIYLNKDGAACYAFGKHKDVPVKKEPGYAEWMLKSDFSTSTKTALRAILNS